MSDTQGLLGEFVSNGSEAAFRELVVRYFDLVYSTAVRLVDGDTHKAQDVAQVVFSDLACMAVKLSEGTMLGGWLHRHTCFVARNVMRGERRRKAREKRAAEMNAIENEGMSVLAKVAPVLDEAINELGADDREAILLRFFEGHNLRSVGEVLGMSENAAQKRVARAVQELGTLLQRRGVSVTTAALAGSLAVGAVKAAPLGLAFSVAGAALSGVGISGSVGATSAKVATVAKVKAGVVAALLVVAVVSVILLKRQPKNSAGNDGSSLEVQLAQQQAGGSVVPDMSDPGAGGPALNNKPSEPPAQDVAQRRTGDGAVSSSRKPGANDAQQLVPGGPIPGAVRLYSQPGSKVRIEGRSTVHDWQVEGSIMGGFMDKGDIFPREGGVGNGRRVWAQAEAFIMVRYLQSVEKDGKPYSSHMDEIMYESLRAELYPKIVYHLVEMSFKGTTNYEKKIRFEYSSRGQLSIAGVTNEILMPIFIDRMDSENLRIVGSTTLRMTSFRIEPPSKKAAPKNIKAEDQVTISFTWLLGPRPDPGQKSNAVQITSQTRSNQQQRQQRLEAETTPAQEEVIPAGLIKLSNTDLSLVLAIYAAMVDGPLDIDESVARVPAMVRFTNTEPVTKAQAMVLLDNALLEQAGIVVTHGESNRVTMRLVGQ